MPTRTGSKNPCAPYTGRMKARYVVRITAADVGSRVTVRSRIRNAEPGDGPSVTDVIGVLRSWADGVLRVERRDGTVADVAEADLLAAKTVPPPPPRRGRAHTGS